MSRLDTFLDAMRPLLEEQGAHGAWLFGSHARGTARAESDIDLIVVQSSDAPRPDRGQFYGPARMASSYLLSESECEEGSRPLRTDTNAQRLLGPEGRGQFIRLPFEAEFERVARARDRVRLPTRAELKESLLSYVGRRGVGDARDPRLGDS